MALSTDPLGGKLGIFLPSSPAGEIGIEKGYHPESGAFAGSTHRCIPVQGGHGHDGIGSGGHDSPFVLVFNTSWAVAAALWMEMASGDVCLSGYHDNRRETEHSEAVPNLVS